MKARGCTLAGRTHARLEAVAEQIRAEGGSADVAEVDALDERQVREHADAVAAEAGSIDVSFNLISYGDVQGTPLVEMPLPDFMQPITTSVTSMFLTTKAATPHMIRQGSGVVLAFGGEGDPMPDYYISSFQVALHAIEALRRQLACELGRHGIRVVTLQTSGVPETIPADEAQRDAIVDGIAASTMLKRPATLDDVGAVAAFAASDRARTITGAPINMTCGATPA